MSRARNQPDAALLARAIDHVRRAIELERDLAEAHATLAFLLVSAGRFNEARRRRAARSRSSPATGAISSAWRTRSGATIGCATLARAMELYPDFPFAHFEAAMVHIARGALDRAESVLREGTIVQDRQANLRQRYPAKGLHWLLGLVRLAQGDMREARAGVRSRGARRAVAALRRRVRDERVRRRRLRRARATGSRPRRCRCSAAPSSSTRSTRGRSSASAPRTPRTATRRAADAAFKHAAAAIEALRARRARQRSDDGRSVSSRRLRPRPTEAVGALDAAGRASGTAVHRVDHPNRAAVRTAPPNARIPGRSRHHRRPRPLNSAFFSLSSRLLTRRGRIVAVMVSGTTSRHSPPCSRRCRRRPPARPGRQRRPFATQSDDRAPGHAGGIRRCAPAGCCSRRRRGPQHQHRRWHVTRWADSSFGTEHSCWS